MTSDDLTSVQAEKLDAVICRHLRFLGRLTRRLNHLGVPPADPLLMHALRAYDAVYALRVTTMYLTCAPGTAGRGEQRREEPADWCGEGI